MKFFMLMIEIKDHTFDSTDTEIEAYTTEEVAKKRIEALKRELEEKDYTDVDYWSEGLSANKGSLHVSVRIEKNVLRTVPRAYGTLDLG